MQKNKLEGVYCIIGEENFLHDTFDQTIKVCLENKVKLFQIRFKNKNIFFEHGPKLKNLIEEIHNHSGLVLVNDDVTQIEEFNFDGIHLGQSDISPIFAKHIYKEKIIGLDVLVINCLQKENHISHFNLDEALSIIKELKVKKAYLTHISHNLGLHKETSKKLPKNVKIAYDSLKISI